MASKIEWTQETWNPVAGCSIISPGCANCYAMAMAARLAAMGVKKYDGLTRRRGGREIMNYPRRRRFYDGGKEII